MQSSNLGFGGGSGGRGGAGDDPEGSPGAQASDNTSRDSGGGGGGVGRIRINRGLSSLHGTFSPAQSTGRTTFGELVLRPIP